mgnify:CR=1 FL=1
MKYLSVLFAFVLILSACTSAPAPTSTPTLTPTPRKVTTLTKTPVPQGKTIVVTNTEDGGTGSFRDALNMAEPYDTITFDPDVFNPDEPVSIQINSSLPELHKEHLTINASNACSRKTIYRLLNSKCGSLFRLISW